MNFSCCIFSAQYLPHIGGVEMYVQKLSKQLVRKGVKVTVVTSKMKDTLDYEINSDGVEIYRTPCFQLMNTRLPILKLSKKLRETEQILKGKKFDLVVINTRFYFLSLFGVKFAYKNNIKSIVIEHGTDYLTLNNLAFDKGIRLFENKITEKIKHYCKDFYGVSQACGDWLKTFDIKYKGTIYNSIDTEILDNIQTVKDYRREYNLDKKAVVISFVGRLVEEKGILQLIQAVNRINEEQTKVYLFIAGDGDLYNKIQQMSLENIKILGQLEFPLVMSLLEATDIFCLPSRSEGFPTVVLEAAYKDCFIITTDKGGAKELIINNDYGEIIADNTVSSIEKAVLCAVESEDYRKRAISITKKRLLSNFTSAMVSEKFIKQFILPEEKNENIADNTGI